MKRQSYRNIAKIKELIVEIVILEKVKDKTISQDWINIYNNFEKEVDKLMPISKRPISKKEIKSGGEK